MLIFATHSVEEMGTWTDFELGKRAACGAAIAKEGATHYTAIGWDNAFKMIAAEINSLSNPDEAAFYTSGRTSNEAAFLYQLFVRMTGTNNLPTAATCAMKAAAKL